MDTAAAWFQIRYDEGFDVAGDQDYANWLHLTTLTLHLPKLFSCCSTFRDFFVQTLPLLFFKVPKANEKEAEPKKKEREETKKREERARKAIGDSSEGGRENLEG